MAKIMTFAQFKQAIGQDKLAFVKGKGRAFATTPLGNLYVAESYSEKKDAYVVEAQGIDGRPELDGTLWLCNTSLKSVDIKIKGE